MLWMKKYQLKMGFDFDFDCGLLFSLFVNVHMVMMIINKSKEKE